MLLTSIMKNVCCILILIATCFSCTEKGKNYQSEYNSDLEMEDVVDNDHAQRYYEQNGEYPDGTYCAEVEYYNPSTGTRNTYSLDVDVEGGDLTIIHWPNGGWLDDTHFYPEDISDGECDFTSDRGYRYTVTLEEFGGCGYTDEYEIRRDINDEVERTTCPNCGEEKSEYDDYCYDCKQELENQQPW